MVACRSWSVQYRHLSNTQTSVLPFLKIPHNAFEKWQLDFCLIHFRRRRRSPDKCTWASENEHGMMNAVQVHIANQEPEPSTTMNTAHSDSYYSNTQIDQLGTVWLFICVTAPDAPQYARWRQTSADAFSVYVNTKIKWMLAAYFMPDTKFRPVFFSQPHAWTLRCHFTLSRTIYFSNIYLYAW